LEPQGIFSLKKSCRRGHVNMLDSDQFVEHFDGRD
jgi:hypothetical protein